MNIQSIDTNYNGYKFRSRLEARWAVYFDTMGWEYLYEPQGYALPDGTRYIPDFFISNFQTFVEVKFDVLEVFDYDRARLLVKTTGIPLVILDSDPDLKTFTQITYDDKNDDIILKQVNMVEDPDNSKELAAGYLLTDKYDYENLDMTLPPEAVRLARAHRFGIFD